MGGSIMATLYVLCILIGGTFLVCQFVMTLLGLGHGGLEGDVAHLHSGVFASHAGGALHTDLDHNTDGNHEHGSSWLFGIISFRTLVAATTVFGLAGMTAQTSNIPLSGQLLVAIVSGGAAMFAVHSLMRFLYQLGQSGNLRISNAIGKTATVSIPILGQSQRCGKVRLIVQGRLEELAAVNSQEGTLASGSQVIVVGVVGGNTLEVAAIEEPSQLHTNQP